MECWKEEEKEGGERKKIKRECDGKMEIGRMSDRVMLAKEGV